MHQILDMMKVDHILIFYFIITIK